MATPRHIRCAELLAEGWEPAAAMVAAGWPEAFARGMAAGVVAWLTNAGLYTAPACPAAEPDPAPDPVTEPDPEPSGPEPDLPPDPEPDATAGAAADGPPGAADDAPADASIGGEIHPSEAPAARRPRRTRK